MTVRPIAPEAPATPRQRARTTTLLIAALATLLGSCGGMARKSQPAMTSTMPNAESAPAMPPGSDPRLREILDRDTEIRSWRGELGLTTDPTLADRQEWASIPLVQAREVCSDPEPATPRCQDVCDLADHICENADEICRIAGDLEGNAWAEDKCASAKVSCKEGKERCCGCTDQPVEPDATTEPDAAAAHPADLPRQ